MKQLRRKIWINSGICGKDDQEAFVLNPQAVNWASSCSSYLVRLALHIHLIFHIYILKVNAKETNVETLELDDDLNFIRVSYRPLAVKNWTLIANSEATRR